MPSKEISIEEYRKVEGWMRDQQVGDLPDMLGVYIVNGEPLVLRGRFQTVIPWPNVLNLSFGTVTTGRADLVCSDTHARALRGIVNFSEAPQQGARTL